jgi:hypothetical protein
MPNILAEWTLLMVEKIRMNCEDFVKSSFAKYPCFFRLKARLRAEATTADGKFAASILKSDGLG